MAAVAEADLPAPAGPGRFRRILTALGASVALTGIFVTALVGSVALHLDLAPTRRTVRSVVNDLVFPGLFQGKLVCGEIDRLNFHGVTIRGADAYDPRGDRVIHAAGLRADADVLGIVQSVLSGAGDMRVLIPLIHLDDAEVVIERGPLGIPTIAEIFQPRGPVVPPPPGLRPVRVGLPRIEIDHAWAHGAVAPPALLDGEISGVVGRVDVSPEGLLVEIDPTQVDLRAPLPQPLGGNVTFRLEGQPHAKDVNMTASFDGQLGDLDVHTTAQLHGTHVAARVELPRTTPEVIGSLLPGGRGVIPLRAPVSVVVDAEGELPEIAFETRVAFDGGGSIDARGTLVARPPVTLDAALAVHGVDPLVVLDLPSATPVDATGHVHLAAGRLLTIAADVATEPFTLAGNAIPGVDAAASFDGAVWTGWANVRETGAPTRATFSFDPREKDLRFEVDARVASLRAVRRLAAPVDGSASVKVKGSLRDGALDAGVTGRFDDVRAPGGVVLAAGGVDGRVKGPLAALEVDASVWGSGVQAGHFSWEKVNAHAHGPVATLKLDAKLDAGEGESLTASGALDAKQKALTGVRVLLKRHGGEVGGRVARVAATAGGMKIEGVQLEGDGIGELKGGLVVAGKEITGKLHGENVDLAKVGQLASFPGHLAGLANVDVDLSSGRPGSRKGHIALEVVKGEFSALKGISGVFTATFDGERMLTDGLFRVVSYASPRDEPDERCDGAIAQVRVTGGDAALPGPLLDPDTWQRVSGKVEVAADDWNLRCISRLAPIGFLLSEVRGKLTTRATVERAAGARIPTVSSFFARTHGLEVAGPRKMGAERAEWDSLYNDVQLDATVDGRTGATYAKVSILDTKLLASASVDIKLDLATLLDDPEHRWASLRRSPFTGSVTVERRAVTAFAALPSFVRDRVPLLAGEVALDGTVRGTIDKPAAAVHAYAWGLAPPSPTGKERPAKIPVTGDAARPELAPVAESVLSAWGVPLDFAATATYDAQKATLDAHVKQDNVEIAAARADIGAPLADVLAGHLHPTGGFSAEVTRLPLSSIPVVGGYDIDGHLTGTLAMTGIGDKPGIKADLKVPDLRVGRDLKYDVASIAVDIAPPHEVKAGDRPASTIKVDLSSPTGGKLSANVLADVLWQNRTVPALDGTRPGELTVKAQSFRIAAATPFVAGAISRLDGVLDGDARLGFRRFDGDTGAELGVTMKLTKGILNIPQLGQELHDIRISLRPDGVGKVKLDELRAEGVRGLITGKGSAQFEGVAFRRADLAFSIKNGDEIPVTLQGVPLGDARGDIAVKAENSDHKLALKIEIPRLHLDLAPALGRSVQATEDNEDVHLRQPLRAPVEELAVAAGARKISVTVYPVHISAKGKLSGAVVDGAFTATQPLRVELDGKHLQVSGQIHLDERGRIEVLQKRFEIEPDAVVTLNSDDLSKSYVSATARWDAPDGTPLYLIFSGEATPLTADKLKDKLKCSAKGLSQERCFSALLLGSGEQGTVAGGGQGAAQGQALAAQLIAAQFSTQIGGCFSTSIGTGDDGSLRPGVKCKVGPWTFEVSTYGLGGTSSSTTATTGGAATKGQHEQVTVERPFGGHWILRGRADYGTDSQTIGGDVLWQYRY